ncbi:MAG: roadblock/LC7 domain-containing protein [Candidatus Helarchaeota archaeon]|nr:roadblock/LC7 domain-containing protein [Candidatus Helarchaeota archaeon]
MAYEAILRKLKEQTGIHGSSLLTVEGLPIAADFPDTGTETALISALSGATLATGAHMIAQFQYGYPDHLTLKGKDGTIFLYQVNDQMVLTVLAPNDVSLGIFTLGIKNAIKDINVAVNKP